MCAMLRSLQQQHHLMWTINMCSGEALLMDNQHMVQLAQMNPHKLQRLNQRMQQQVE
jgi:hypothetical protein